MNVPELSIIVPTLNEAEALPGLFSMLTAQRDVAFEVILSDGGSTDGTVERAGRLGEEAPFACTVLKGERGRARQLNAGAGTARGETLLFLHADSFLVDSLALRRSLDALSAVIADGGDEKVAGHFALRFDRRDESPSPAYRYYEFKARLDRPGCTHGDQGFMLLCAFFRNVGPFDESLPLLEDTRLAEKIRSEGRWLLLPAEIRTSARRFETEGLYERQLLNALIMNFAAIGWDAFFRAVPGIYRGQDGAGRLRLHPFLNAIRELLRPLPWRERCRLWYETGRFVRANAWQLALALDVRRNFRRGVPLEEMTNPALDLFDRWFDRLTDHPPGRLVATALVRCWFFLICRRLGGKDPLFEGSAEQPECEKEQP